MTSFRLIAVGLVLGGLLTAPALAQRPAPRQLTVPAVGTEVFRGLLRYHKIEPVRPEELGPGDYADLIVIVVGHVQAAAPWGTSPAPHTQQALRAGGAVLIATEDRASLASFFPDRTDLRVTGERVLTHTPGRLYAGAPHCPFVAPRQPDEIDKLLWAGGVSTPDPEWGLFLGLDQLATNVPGALQMTTASRYTHSKLAGYPPGSQIDLFRRTELPADRLFAVAGSGRGDRPFRSLVLADPSVFSNQMMAPVQGMPPNHNLVFADRAVQWLRGPRESAKCLFIENGVARTDFDRVRFETLQPLPPLPIPPPPDLLDPTLQRQVTDAINGKIADVQDRDVLDRRLAHDDPSLNRVVRFLAGAAAVVVLILLTRRAWRGRHDPDVPPVPADTGRVTGTAPAGSVARRREEILQSGDYGEMVREYLQELFASHGLPVPVTKPVRRKPDVRVRGPGSTTLREDLRILWEEAFGPRPQPVDYARWKELEPIIDDVRRAAAEGRWRFAETGDAA